MAVVGVGLALAGLRAILLDSDSVVSGSVTKEKGTQGSGVSRRADRNQDSVPVGVERVAQESASEMRDRGYAVSIRFLDAEGRIWTASKPRVLLLDSSGQVQRHEAQESSSWRGFLNGDNYSVYGVVSDEGSHEILDEVDLSRAVPDVSMRIRDAGEYDIEVRDSVTGEPVRSEIGLYLPNEDPPRRMRHEADRDKHDHRFARPGAAFMKATPAMVTRTGRFTVQQRDVGRMYWVGGNGLSFAKVTHERHEGDVCVDLAAVGGVVINTDAGCTVNVIRKPRGGGSELAARRKSAAGVIELIDLPAGNYVALGTKRLDGVTLSGQANFSVEAGILSRTELGLGLTNEAQLDLVLLAPAGLAMDGVHAVLTAESDEEWEAFGGFAWRRVSDDVDLGSWEELTADRAWVRSFRRLAPGRYDVSVFPFGVEREVVLSPGEMHEEQVEAPATIPVRLEFPGWAESEWPIRVTVKYTRARFGHARSFETVGQTTVMHLIPSECVMVARGTGGEERVVSLAEASFAGGNPIAVFRAEQTLPRIDLEMWRCGRPAHLTVRPRLSVSSVEHRGELYASGWEGEGFSRLHLEVTRPGAYRISISAGDLGSGDVTVEAGAGEFLATVILK